jgi:hypothetical protein
LKRDLRGVGTTKKRIAMSFAIGGTIVAVAAAISSLAF